VPLVAAWAPASRDTVGRGRSACRNASLDHDTRATLRDADFAIGEYLRRIQWNRGRIEQVQAALSSHKPLVEGAHIERAGVVLPADPAWEAAKASGMIPLFSQGEIAAYSEVADLVSRTRPLLEAVSSASLKRSDFEARYKPVSGDAASNYRLESPADLQAYLDLLIAPLGAEWNAQRRADIGSNAERGDFGAIAHGRTSEKKALLIVRLPFYDRLTHADKITNLKGHQHCGRANSCDSGRACRPDRLWYSVTTPSVEFGERSDAPHRLLRFTHAAAIPRS
jgi:hypothetical protein